MEAEAKTPQPEPNAGVMAGQPITFGGVAAFAQASWRRLFITQAVVAGGGVAAILIFLFNAWLPAIDQAIGNLPENGYILRGELAWPHPEPVQLTESRWLTVIVAPMNTHTFGQSADFQLELHAKEARLYSMLGYLQVAYSKDFSLQLSRPDAVPWWGARRPFFVAGAIVGTFFGLWLLWMLLAVLYAPGAKFVAFWRNRDLTWIQAIRLSAAALLTPAVVFSLAIALYGLGWVPLEVLIAGCVLHVVMGWAYVAGAPMRLPLRPEVAAALQKNPFDQPDQKKTADKPVGNPFKDK
jgi:hypothetical protein